MIRMTIFIIALLLAIAAIDAEPPWLVTLAVLSGIELLRIGPFGWRRHHRPWRRAWRWDDDW
ncbi:MAG: hypothetical protein WBD55_04740 [Dehalococcoidia bacterium]